MAPRAERGSHEKDRFSEDQLVRILREADSEAVPKVAKRHGVSEQTVYTWRKRYGELEVADVRLKSLLRARDRSACGGAGRGWV